MNKRNFNVVGNNANNQEPAKEIVFIKSRRAELKGCRICKQEYLSLFPALAVSYYRRTI